MIDDLGKFKLDDLVRLFGLSKRQIRYYIQLGLLEPPLGSKRGAYYVQSHIDQLKGVRYWQKRGLSLDRIAGLLAWPDEDEMEYYKAARREPGDVEVWSHLFVQNGVELHIEPGLADLKPEQVRALSRGVMALIEEVKSGEPEE